MINAIMVGGEEGADFVGYMVNGIGNGLRNRSIEGQGIWV